mmetsp:Transcript_22363/g.49813  ORF Transcript_22363/g.49813 Transcript_22363/m.49813 type:complete len:520 (-) Transcript_22363:1060-2619(-)
MLIRRLALRQLAITAVLGKCSSYSSGHVGCALAFPAASAFVSCRGHHRCSDASIQKQAIYWPLTPHHVLNRHGSHCALFFSTINSNEKPSDMFVDGSYVDGGYTDESEEADDTMSSSSQSDGDDATPSRAPPSRSVLLHRAVTKGVTKALTAIERKNASLQRELDKAQSLEGTMSRANLIISNLYRLPPGTTTATVEDWDNDGESVELELNTKEYSSAQEEADALFATARKMKRGSAVIEGLMEDSAEAEQLLRDAMMDLDAAAGSDSEDDDDIAKIDEGMLVLIQERLERTSSKTGFKMPSVGDGGSHNKQRVRQQQQGGGNSSQRKRRRREPTYRHLTSPSGLKVLVGRNRRDNEAICFQEARQDDVWMHARGCPGAHVLLCVRRGSAKPTSEDLQFAANLAAFYSDARTERRAAVTTADCKHIQKPRGAPLGAVKVRQEGPTLLGRPEDVAEELKAAREESGGAWDEQGYRKLGTRSKNKKRSAAVEKQNQAKRRAEKKDKKKRRQSKQDSDDEFY